MKLEDLKMQPTSLEGLMDLPLGCHARVVSAYDTEFKTWQTTLIVTGPPTATSEEGCQLITDSLRRLFASLKEK